MRLKRRALRLSLLAGAAALLGFLGCKVVDRPAGGVQIVLITLDTLRFDSFSGAAGDASTMPKLLEWSEQSTVFERHYSSSASTQPSHASMFTGLHPWGHGMSRNGLVLAEEQETVAEKLKGAGFSTAAVVSSFPVAKRFGFGQGFDHYDDAFELGQLGQGNWMQHSKKQDVEGAPKDKFYTLAQSVTGKATDLLDTLPGERRFFWFHYFDPHSPYGDCAGGDVAFPQDPLRLARAGQDPTALLAKTRRLYDDDVADLDRFLGRLLSRLARDSADTETHVLIVADHGESFGEGGSTGHGRRLTEAELHVPLLVRSPLLEPGRRPDVSGSVDVYSTLLALAGLPTEAPSRGSSRDLTAPPPSRGWAFGLRQTYVEPFRDLRLDGQIHVVDGLLFYAVDEEGRILRGNSQEYWGALDATDKDPEVEGRLRRVFTGFERDLAKNAADALVDSETRRTLQALGYVG